jgi:NitT/TauT family transport system substrate-binding protein
MSSTLKFFSRRNALGLLCAAGATLARQPRAVAQSSAQTLRIAVIKATILAPSLLVERYLPTGWKTEMTFFTTPADMTNALLTDSVDIAYTGLTIGVVARSRNQPVIVVANQGGKGTAIVARADSSIRSIADLRGKKVGNLPTSIHDILLREELKKANVRMEDLTLIRLAPADMPAALRRGDIDAFSGNEPNSSITVLQGYGRVIMYPYDNPVGPINVGVLTSEMHFRDKRAMLNAWIFAHAKATEEMAKDPVMWTDVVVNEWGFDREATRRSLNNLELKWQMDAAFMGQFAAFSERLKDLGVITSVPSVSTLVVRDLVNNVRL